MTFMGQPSADDKKAAAKEAKVKDSNANKLLAFAWIIEILAAAIGFFFAYTTGKATEKFLNPNNDALISTDVSVILAMLPFMIIGIVEITKIPLAYAAYSAKPGFWKTLFIGVLISLCFVTGETIFTGMERSLNNQTQYFEVEERRRDELREEVIERKERVSELSRERKTKDIDSEYDLEINAFEKNHFIRLDELREERQSRLTELENKKLQSREMHMEGSSKDEVANLQSLLDSQLSRIEALEDRVDNEVSNIRETAQKEIDSKQAQINALTESMAAITQEFESGLFNNNDDRENQLNEERAVRSKAEGELELIIRKRDEDIQKYRDTQNSKLSNLNQEFIQTQSLLSSARLKSEEEFKNEQNSISQEIEELKARYDSRQAGIQDDYDDERAFREANYLAKRKRAESIQAAIDAETASMDQAKEEIKQLGKTIRTKAREIQVMRFAAIYAEYISDGKIKGEENVTQEHIGVVMMIWFGSISIIAAITGTVIAFASFYIKDKRNGYLSWIELGGIRRETIWEELVKTRREKNEKRKEYYLKRIDGELPPGAFRSIGLAVVRLIDAMVQRLKEPKIVKVPIRKHIPYDFRTGKPVDGDKG